jgi:hypothetical protein
MKRLSGMSMAFVVILVLAGCAVPDVYTDSDGFPSQRLYQISCNEGECGVLENGGELAFVKETSGENWRLLLKMPEEKKFSEVCTGTINGDEFSCTRCGPSGHFTVVNLDSSECGFDHCVSFEHSGPNCPTEGIGKGGHN